MNPATMRKLTQEAYHRLLSYACRETDFAYIGSVGNGPARGVFSGFTARAFATEVLQHPVPADFCSDQLAHSMESLVRQFQIDQEPNPKCLSGGWIGFLSYELGYVRESRLKALCPSVDTPLMSSGFYLWTATHNRKTDQYWLWIHPECPGETRNLLEQWLRSDEPAATTGWAMGSHFQPRQTPDAFRASVERIRQYIEAGDCYQANLSQEFSGHFMGDPWQAFQELSDANPTPYSGFIRAGEASILSVSPERFLEIHDRTVTTSPIKGTRPRGGTPESDSAYATELEGSEKDLAENLMIVDLLRNDLSLNAKPGSVKVDKLFALESYRNVHHLVSHIRAELAEGVTPMKALFDAFPGGSITGAPKIRAMEIIRELEPHWRGPYCGSIFYRGLDGTLDSNIAIRTMLCDGQGTIRCWGGGGIVADSDPEAEYQETLAKVGPLMRFLEELVIE
ncbi:MULTISPECIES: aminodeoxychorismate synthase component I [unclassified Marinobacter]|uniref:aminodeoxychorismate synthase component I n=2 Tax=Marinobacteraceae TaxID=2887365 RepID=UPI000B0E7783|nr:MULTISPECIES: aminodeoxychorismate synthase component I [unclassified Marinobacter]